MMERDDIVRMGAAVVGLGVVIYFGRKLLPYGSPAPDTDGVGMDVGGMYSDVHPDGFGEHFLPPDQFGGPAVVLPVRYPVRAGHNISTLITHGMAPLYRPRPNDADMIMNPPTEVTV